MTAPTQRALRTFWESQPEGNYTCSDCGTVGPKAYIQPQHPYYAHGREGTALCSDCISRHNREITAARKAELAAAPRCTLCKARGTARTYGVLLCGRHLANVKRAHGRTMAGVGGMALFMMPPDYSPEQIISMARDGAS